MKSKYIDFSLKFASRLISRLINQQVSQYLCMKTDENVLVNNKSNSEAAFVHINMF